MKVLAIMGSPKGKGKGFEAVKKVEEHLKGMGEVDFEYLFLKDADLKPCKGCFVCISRGEDLCPLKDERAAIEKKLLEADGVILSSPGYVQNVSALMKNFMDRFAYTNHRLRFFNQKTLIIANGGSGMNKTNEALRIALGGADIVDAVEIYSPPWKIKPKTIEKNERKLKDSAKKLYAAISNKTMKKPSFNEYMRFRFMKDMLSPGMQKYLPADFEFYKDKEYYYDVPISGIKKSAVGMLVRFVFWMMRDIGPADA